MGDSNFILKEFIEFMWKKYDTSICFFLGEVDDKTLLGEYISYIKIGREKRKIIFINLENINDEITKIFTLFHEIGHFLLEKSNFIQKEEYANFLAYYLIRKFNTKNINISNSILIKKLNLRAIFLLEENIKKELLDIGYLFCYSYFKFLMEGK